MTVIRDPAIAQLLAEARAQFAAALVARVDELRELVQARAWDGARGAAHKLRGSTGTYGFAELSAACGDIEDQLLEADLQPGPQACERIALRMGDAVAEAERAADISTLARAAP